MHILENLPPQNEGNESLKKRVNSFLDGCSSEELEKKDKNLLDKKIEKLDYNELLNLIFEIQQYLSDPQIGLVDEYNSNRYLLVRSAACLRLEELDAENK
jgi:hypothetical protein